MTTAEDFENGGGWAWESRLRLAKRRYQKPETKAGQIRAVWPEIAAALESGQSIKCIRQWLQEDAGIIVSTSSLTSYISRLRRRESLLPPAHEAQLAEVLAVDHPVVRGDQRVRLDEIRADHIAPPCTPDPISQAMRALTKPRLDIRKLHGDGDPSGKSLI